MAKKSRIIFMGITNADRKFEIFRDMSTYMMVYMFLIFIYICTSRKEQSKKSSWSVFYSEYCTHTFDDETVISRGVLI